MQVSHVLLVLLDHPDHYPRQPPELRAVDPRPDSIFVVLGNQYRDRLDAKFQQ